MGAVLSDPELRVGAQAPGTVHTGNDVCNVRRSLRSVTWSEWSLSHWKTPSPLPWIVELWVHGKSVRSLRQEFTSCLNYFVTSDSVSFNYSHLLNGGNSAYLMEVFHALNQEMDIKVLRTNIAEGMFVWFLKMRKLRPRCELLSQSMGFSNV